MYSKEKLTSIFEYSKTHSLDECVQNFNVQLKTIKRSIQQYKKLFNTENKDVSVSDDKKIEENTSAIQKISEKVERVKQVQPKKTEEEIFLEKRKKEIQSLFNKIKEKFLHNDEDNLFIYYNKDYDLEYQYGIEYTYSESTDAYMNISIDNDGKGLYVSVYNLSDIDSDSLSYILEENNEFDISLDFSKKY